MEQSVIASTGVQELCRLFKDDENLWIKSPVHGRDVLVQHNYECAFGVSNNMRTRNHNSWIEASRSFAYVKEDHVNLAISLIEDNWTYLFPNMVAKEETIAVLSPGSSEDNPDGSLKLMYKELQVTSPLVAKRKFTCLRTCKQIDQGTWVVADISYEPILNFNGYHSNYRRLPSGCLIQSISEKLSKVTWVEHMEVKEIMPNHTLYDHLIRSGLAFGAERMLASLERWHERMSHMNDICRIRTPGLEGKVAPWIMEKFSLMEFGESMVSGLFENISPNEDKNSSLWRSITGLDDLKVYATLYKSSSSYEVVGGAVTFGVKYSPEFVLKILGDERKHHEWDVVGGLRKLNIVTQYLTAGDPRNNVSASLIEGSSDGILIKEVNVNRSGSVVVWTTVSKKIFDLISLGKAPPPDVPMLISGFSISTDGHTTATNRGGSVVTLVLRMWGVLGNKPLQEKGPESVALITLAINLTVGRVKEALEKQRPPSPPTGVWPTEEQQVGGDDMETEILQNELRLLKMN